MPKDRAEIQEQIARQKRLNRHAAVAAARARKKAEIQELLERKQRANAVAAHARLAAKPGIENPMPNHPSAALRRHNPYRPTPKQEKKARALAAEQASQAGLVPAGPFGRIAANLLEDAGRAALGFVPSLIQGGRAAGTDVYRRDYSFPRTRRQVVDPLVENYRHTYGPAVRGDFGTTLGRIAEHPLGPLLDAASVATLGTAGAARAGLIRTPSRVAHITVDGGKVQRQTSPNPLTRIVEEKANRLSERHPDVPYLGGRDRATRAIRNEREIELEREQAGLIPFDSLARKLKKRKLQNIAYDVMARYGSKALERIDEEIAFRRSQPRTTHQVSQIVMLKAARKHVERPTPLIRAALVEGRKVTEGAQGDLIALGQLTPETAAAAVDRHSKLVTGGKYEASKLEGGEAAGSDAFFVPDTARMPIKSLGQRVRSVTGKPRRIVHRSEGILFTHGRIRRGAQLTTESALRTKRSKVQLADIDQVNAEWGRPLVPTPENPTGLLPDHVYFNPEGFRLPRRARDELEHDLTPREWAASVADDYDLLQTHIFPPMPPGMEAVKQVPEWVAAAYQKGGTRFPGQGSLLVKTIAGSFKLLNNVARLGAIYLKPAYAPVNFAANELLAIVQQGPWHPINLARAAGLMGDFSPNTLRRLDVEAGSGGALAVAGEGQGLTGTIVHKVAGFQTAIADRLPRRTAIIHELSKAGYKTDAEVNALLDDASRRAELNVISRDAENAMVRFRGLSPDEKAIISNAIFIYPWVKGSTRYSLRLPIDHPVKADVLAHIGEEGYEELRETVGEVASFLRTRTPVSDLEKTKLGEIVAKVVSPDSASPFGTGVELVEALWGAASGRRSNRDLIEFASPAVKTPFELTTGYDTFAGRDFEEGTSALDILLSDPKEYAAPKFVAGMIDPPDDTRYFKAGGRQEVAGRFGLGSLYPRTLNVTAAREKGKQERDAVLTPAERKYRKDIDTLYREWREFGAPGEPDRAIVEDLLWRRDLALDIKQAEDAKGERLTAKEKAELAARAVVARYPEVAENVDNALRRARIEPEYESLYKRILREATPMHGRWSRESKPIRIERELAELEQAALAAAS